MKARESKETGNNRALPLRELYKEKKDLQVKLQKELSEAKKNYNEIKDTVKDLFDQ